MIPRAKTHYPTEHQDQQALVAWAGFQRIPEGTLGEFLLMIPNEGLLSFLPEGPRRHAYWAKLKSLGFRKGASDLFLSLPRGRFHGLYLENKRHRRYFGTVNAQVAAVSEDQAAFQERMALVGYAAKVAYGFDEGKVALQEYLAL